MDCVLLKSEAAFRAEEQASGKTVSRRAFGQGRAADDGGV
jgi:hypothetical protein